MKTDVKTDILWDVVVIGGGPSGMMAAGRAAELGRKVLLLEKNPTLGKKLLITGGGRCNLTNNKPDIRTMLSQYKGNARFLFSAFSQFSVEDTLNFFHRRGVPTVEEEEGRVFPVSNKAQSVLNALTHYMKDGGVRIQTNTAVAGLSIDAETEYIAIRIKGALANKAGKTEIIAKSCIVATGGVSHPETGSTGEGFAWLKKIGHTIIDNDFALVPIALTDAWAKKLSGSTLKDIKLTAFQNGQKQETYNGILLFTHFGISGPTVLNMSKAIRELLQYGEVAIALDVFPKFDHKELEEQLQTLLVGKSNKKLKNTLDKLIPAALVFAVLKLANVDGETPNHSVRREDRIKLVSLMKRIPLHVQELLGADKAVISSGGAALKEVNFKTMQSRLVPNLYLIGDALNIDRPSGGYSLQLCWTTGFVAGEVAAKVE